MFLSTRHVLALAIVSTCLAAACGGADTVVADAGVVDVDAGIADVGTGTITPDPVDAATTDGGMCNGIVNGAPLVTAELVYGPPPTATGGTFVSGTYFMTGLTYYIPATQQVDGGDAGPPSAQWRETNYVQVTLGTAVERVFAPGDMIERRVNFAIDEEGPASVTFKTSCGVQGTISVPYSVTPIGFTMYIPFGNGSMREQRFAKQLDG